MQDQFKFGAYKHRQTSLINSSVPPDSVDENDGVKSIPAGDCLKTESEVSNV